MNSTITITQQWQMYIPESIREALGLTEPTQVLAEVQGDTLIIRPKKNRLLSLGGAMARYAPRQKVDSATIRDSIDYSDL
jgi:AbrB family looped-hinge helix DNA binding protein